MIELTWRFRLTGALLALMLASVAPACSDDDDDDDSTPQPTDDDDDDDTVPSDDDDDDDDDDDVTTNDDDDDTDDTVYDEWVKVEPEGAVCGLGTQFKFFINRHEGSDNLLISFQGGGACWEWDMCSPEGTSNLGASNKEGVPDDHMGLWEFAHPYLQRDHVVNMPTRDWNYVFVPYCTGDINTGNSVQDYEDPNGIGAPVTFHHQGYNNMTQVIEHLKEEFPSINKMLVTGCSAGGFAANVNYFRLRDGLNADKGYLLNDSGPIFTENDTTKPLFDTARAAWGLDSIIPEDCDGCLEDFGKWHEFLANRYPDDRLTASVFRRDFNVSRFYFEKFIDEPTKEHIHEVFWENLQNMMDTYDSHPNMAYYIPYWREFNDSHCVSIVVYAGTEVQEAGVDYSNFIKDLLDDDKPLMSYLESVQPEEDLPEPPSE